MIKEQLDRFFEWSGPTEEMLNDTLFNAIWNAIKTWDINVPEIYNGYTGAMGNHARIIYDSIMKTCKEEQDKVFKDLNDE